MRDSVSNEPRHAPCVARAVIEWHDHGRIEYIPFPDRLEDSYQSFTEADISRLREAGYSPEFLNIEDGVKRYLDELGS